VVSSVRVLVKPMDELRRITEFQLQEAERRRQEEDQRKIREAEAEIKAKKKAKEQEKPEDEETGTYDHRSSLLLSVILYSVHLVVIDG
jgi:hypothetical protein